MTRKALKITAALALSILVIMSCGRDISDDNAFVGNFRAEFQNALDAYYVSNGETDVPVDGNYQPPSSPSPDYKYRFLFPEYNGKVNGMLTNAGDPACPVLAAGVQITVTWDAPPVTINGLFFDEGIETIGFVPCQTCTAGVYTNCSPLLPLTQYTLTVADLPDGTPGTTRTFTTGTSPNTVPPVISITSGPSNEDFVTDTINIILNVTDDDTATPEVVLTVDGGPPIVPTTITGSSYEFVINTHDYTTLTTHTFTFDATDYYFNLDTFILVLNINNPGLCNDGIDNDGDTLTDYYSPPEGPDGEPGGASVDDNQLWGLNDPLELYYPNTDDSDPGCSSSGDSLETGSTECDDGIDNDGDTLIDKANDPGCKTAADTSELGDCEDGIDNDGDTAVDTNDPGCPTSLNPDEKGDNECDDSWDNDGDTLIDYPADPDCISIADESESPMCRDGFDNDGDTFIDFPSDPGCTDLDDISEYNALVECDDGIDNDGDLSTDYPSDPGCASVIDTDELGVNECDDGIDNDSDTFIDYPSDLTCASSTGFTETSDPSAPIAFMVDDIDSLEVYLNLGTDPLMPDNPILVMEAIAWDASYDTISNNIYKLGSLTEINFTDGSNGGNYNGVVLLSIYHLDFGNMIPFTIPANSTVKILYGGSLVVEAYLPPITLDFFDQTILYVAGDGSSNASTFYAHTSGVVMAGTEPDLQPAASLIDWATYLAQAAP